MKPRTLLAILGACLAFAAATPVVHAATEDVLSVTVRPDGWTADVVIEGLSTGGVYDLGWTSRIQGDHTSGTFVAGETVTQTGTGATGKAWGPADNNATAGTDALWIYTASRTGSPNASGTWIGGISGAIFTPTFAPVELSYPPRSTPKIALTVVSHGYQDNTSLGTITRTVYATTPVRKPWDQHAFNEESVSGGNLTVRLALDDVIYQMDATGGGNSGTAPVVSILGGFYNQGGNENNATGAGFAVTNSSTAGFRDSVRNWSWPGYERLTPTSKLRAVVFHRHGRLGRPVRAVKFSVSDGVNPPNEEIVLNPTWDASLGDQVPVIEYTTSTNLVAGLTQGAELTINFSEYPWVGNNSTSTSTGASGLTPLVGPKTGVCDRLGTYGVTCAKVASGGNDGTGVAYDSAAFDVNTATPFATIAGAAKAIKDYNTSTHMRGDVGAGEIHLHNGAHLWMGAALGAVYGTTPKCWLTVKAADYVEFLGDVVINGSSGNTDVSDRVKFERIKFDLTTSNTFSGCLATWLDDCELGNTDSATWNSSGQVVWITQGLARQFNQGFRSYSTSNVSFALVRGMDLTAFSGTNHIYTTLGNKRAINAPGGPTFVGNVLGQTAPLSVPILAYNELYGYDVSSGTAVIRMGHLGVAHPAAGAIVQNLIEVSTGNSGGNGNVGSSEGSVVANTPIDDIIFYGNTSVGGRMQFAYNSQGSIIKHRRFWKVGSNYWDISGYKTDTFTGSGGGNGARVGNWMVGFGVGSTDNVNGNISAINTPGFDFDFLGLNSTDTPSGNAVDYPQFIDRRSYNGSAGLGVGNYRVLETSPLAIPQLEWMIPFDLDGNPRDGTNAATGVYVVGQATNTAPTVVISSPANGASTTSPATLTGTATDPQQEHMTQFITWSSNIDGALGTGGTVVTGLSVGAHTITASITDNGSLTDTDSITLNITAPAGASATATTVTGNIRIQ